MVSHPGPVDFSRVGNPVDEFLLYFLGGMFGAELIRKIATRPYGFLVLWLMSFILVNILAVIFVLSLGFLTLFEVGIAAGQSLFSTILLIIREGLVFFFVMMQPWAALFCLGVSFLLAFSYYGHYHNSLRESQESKTKK